MLRYSSKKDFERTVCANLIAHCSFIPENVTHAHTFFGENITGLRGKTVCQKLEQMVMDCIYIAQQIVQKNKDVMLTADVMFVNNLLFVVTSGQGIGLIMEEFMPTCTATQLACSLK